MAGEETHTLKTLVDAAQRGDTAAQFELGRRYYRGEGTPSDAMTAMRWFRRAADKGHVVAKIYLSELMGEDSMHEEPALQRWLNTGQMMPPARPSLPTVTPKPPGLTHLRRRASVPVFVVGLGLALAVFLWWWHGNLFGLR